MVKYFAGIGSRETPSDILVIMRGLGTLLAYRGWTLRSGGALGADTAFEEGCDIENGRKEIFFANDASKDAIEIAEHCHPAWHRCTEVARKLHGRNAMIVLGRDLRTPARFVVCWTKDGLAVGGTGLAIRIANRCTIPVINLFDKDKAYRELDAILAQKA